MKQYHIGLFGATGATGLEVAKQSLLQNDKLTILVRKPSKVDVSLQESPNVTIIQGDARNVNDVDKVVGSGIDGVINTVGMVLALKLDVLV